MKCALIYDFDGTLAEGDCANYGLFDNLGEKKDPNKKYSNFWSEVKERAKKEDGDEILSYLGLLQEKDSQGKHLQKEALINFGKKIKLFKGVEDWFDRINKHGRKNGLAINHYIISSGLDAMIQGTPIAKHFQTIYACKYHYDENKKATWVAQAVNYTTKTQFLFRINKGIHNSWDNKAVNKFIEPSKRDIPFERMIYLGDGDTDIPSMKTVRTKGGFSIAVFDEWEDENTQKKVGKLIAEERANYVVPADYTDNSQLDVTVKGLLQLISRKN